MPIDDDIGGISNLPQSRLDKFRSMQADTPKSRKKWVNGFIERQVLGTSAATNMFFEEITTNTSKEHRSFLHQKLRQTGFGMVQDGKMRGATAEGHSRQIGLGYHGQERAVGSQSIPNRSYRTQELSRISGSDNHYEEVRLKSNLNQTAYPGRPHKLKSNGMLPHTLNALERGEQGKQGLKSISGIDYYRQHIHGQQQARLKKFVKNAAGKSQFTKNFVAISEVEKPSMKNKVQMYMKKLNEEEKHEAMAKRGSHSAVDNQSVTVQSRGSATGILRDQNTPKKNQLGRMSGLEPSGPSIKSPLSPESDLNRGAEVISFADNSPSTKRGSRRGEIRFKDFQSGEQSLGQDLNKFAKRMSVIQPGPYLNKMQSHDADLQPHFQSKSAASRRTVAYMGSNQGPLVKVDVTKGKNKLQPGVDNIDEANEAQEAGTPTNFTMNLANKMARDRSLTTKQAVQKAQSIQAPPQINKSDSPQKEIDKSTLMPKQVKKVPTKTAYALSKMTSVNTRGNPFSRKGTYATMNDQEEDYERKIVYMLRNHNVFKDVGNLEPNELPPLRPAPEATFKKICDDPEVSLKNARINQRKLKKHLAKRYNVRLATKMTSIFDWINLTEYKQFYFVVDKEFLGRKKDENAAPNQVIISQNYNFMEHAHSLKHFAFNLFDMNCDNQVCEADLFSFMRNLKDDEFFRKIMHQDITDIQKSLIRKKEELKSNDPVFNNENEKKQRIKNLQAFLEQAVNKSNNRDNFYNIFVNPGKDITSIRNTSSLNDNAKNSQTQTFMTESFKTGGGDTNKATATHSPSKQFDSFNATVKEEQFMSGKKGQETGKQKTGIAFMNQEAVQQDVKQRRGSLGHVIHQANKLYGTKSQLPQLSLDDFINHVEFKFGIPLIVLDYIDTLTGSDFIQQLHEYINPPKDVERFDTNSVVFHELKNQIDEDFLINIYSIFNALGAVDMDKYGSSITPEDRESKQYITLESLCRNLPKVFGIRNDFFARMLFEYMSSHSPHTHIVNYFQFFERFMVLWPRKEVFRPNEDKDQMEWRLTNERKARTAALRKFIFEFMRIQGDKNLCILDLIQLCAHFPKKTTLGAEVHKLIDRYIAVNIKPAYVPVKMQYTFNNFIKYLPYPCLIKELEYAFVNQFETLREKQEVMSDDPKNPTVVKFPITDYKMTAIQDEQNANPSYFKELNSTRAYYRLDKTLVRPPQEFCSFEHADLQDKVVSVLWNDLYHMTQFE